MKENNETAARELVISAWRDHQLNAAVEKKILDRYGSMLTAEHHRARIDRLLYPDEKGATEAALRVAKLLSAAEQKKVAARIAVIKRGGNAGKLLNALPANAVEADVGLRFNRIQWLRRTKDKDRREEAWKMLLDAPSEPNVLLDLNNWWTERRINCRGALNDGNPRVAYEIAAKHGLVPGDAYIEAEFLAGWIALRFLGDPHSALRHFMSLRRAATSSKSIALGEYWLGRTALALGDNGSAMIHFHGAAKYPQYFYGQLGRQTLDARPARLEVTSTPLPTQADIQSFLSRDAVRAIGVARAMGYDGVHLAILPGAVAQAHQPGRSGAARRARQDHRRSADRAQAGQDRPQSRSPARRLCFAGRRHARVQEPALRSRRSGAGARSVAAGERVQRRRQEPGRRERPDAADAGHRQSGSQAYKVKYSIRRS